MKALIAYGTRYGATRTTSERIAEVLLKNGTNTTVINAKNAMNISVEEYDLIVVGSGIKFGKWTKEAENFLRRHRGALQCKQLAIFVSSALWPLFAIGGPFHDELGKSTIASTVLSREEAQMKYLLMQVKKQRISPFTMDLFGGILDFAGIGGVSGMILKGLRNDLEQRGVDTSMPYDNRDWNKIDQWSMRLVRANG